MDKKRLIVSAGLILLFPLSLAAGWFYAKSLPRFSNETMNNLRAEVDNTLALLKEKVEGQEN